RPGKFTNQPLRILKIGKSKDAFEPTIVLLGFDRDGLTGCTRRNFPDGGAEVDSRMKFLPELIGAQLEETIEADATGRVRKGQVPLHLDAITRNARDHSFRRSIFGAETG